MDGGGRSRLEQVIESNAGAIADDCKDAGDRAMQEQLPRAPAKPIAQTSGCYKCFDGLFFEPDQIRYPIGVTSDGFRWRSTHPTTRGRSFPDLIRASLKKVYQSRTEGFVLGYS
jgi:hypothetical protein